MSQGTVNVPGLASQKVLEHSKLVQKHEEYVLPLGIGKLTQFKTTIENEISCCNL